MLASGDVTSAAAEWGETIALAVLQGVTEFLPISSSGHLDAWKRLTGSKLQGDLSLDVILHFATLLAVLLVYRKDVVRLLGGIVRGGPARRELLLVGVGTIPAGLVGLFAKDSIEGLSGQLPFLLPICWGLCGVALLTSRRRMTAASADPAPGEAPQFGVREALWIGMWQMVALLPGVSRSGITIVAALWVGVDREHAARYSFLIAAPLIAGATALEARDLFSEEGLASAPAILASGFAVAFFVGLGALALLLRMLRGGRLHLWGYYLIAIAIGFSAVIALSDVR